jgi:hypothetical protein
MPRKQKELTAEEKAEALRLLDDHEKELKVDIADIEHDRKKLNIDSANSLGLRITFQVLKDTLDDLQDELVQCAKERTKLLKLVSSSENIAPVERVASAHPVPANPAPTKKMLETRK